MPRISDLPPLTSPEGADELPIVDDSASESKKVSLTDLGNNGDWLDTGGVADGAILPPKWSNPYKFQAYMGSNQTTAAVTYTKLNMNTEVYDTNNNYSTSTYGYTAPVAGYYHFDLTAILLSQAGAVFMISLGKNSTAEFVRLEEIPNTTGNITISGSVDLLLAANDVIYPLYYSATASKTILAGFQYGRFSGHLISET